MSLRSSMRPLFDSSAKQLLVCFCRSRVKTTMNRWLFRIFLCLQKHVFASLMRMTAKLPWSVLSSIVILEDVQPGLHPVSVLRTLCVYEYKYGTNDYRSVLPTSTKVWVPLKSGRLDTHVSFRLISDVNEVVYRCADGFFTAAVRTHALSLVLPVDFVFTPTHWNLQTLIAPSLSSISS